MKPLLALMLVSSAALADDAALLRCRQLADGPLRLSCYNAIPVGATVAAAAPAVAPAAARAVATLSVGAGYAVATPEKSELERMFGNEPAVLKSVQLATIESTIPGAFDGWVPGQRIRLANGQVWKVVDNTDDVMDVRDPKVTVRRGLLGALFLDIEGAHRNPRVQRVE
ncbi:MAG: hypothetical protein ACEQSK_10885 [Sphingomonadaceae bacterium]